MRKRRRLVRTAIALLLAIGVCGAAAFAESYDTADVREGDVELSIPEGWSLEEMSSGAEDVSSIGVEDDTRLSVGDLYNENGDLQGSLFAVYQEEPAFDADACATKEDAKAFYEDEGKDLLETILDEYYDVSTYSDRYQLIPDSDQTHYVIRTSSEAGMAKRVYLFKNTEHLIGCLVFGNEDGTLPDAEVTDQIAGSVSWVNYDAGLFERSYESGDWEDGDVDGEGIIILLAVLAIGISYVVSLGGKKKTKPAKERPSAAEKGLTERLEKVLEGKPPKKKTQKKSESDDFFAQAKDSRLYKRVHQHPDGTSVTASLKTRHATPVRYSGYMESLKTLRKSGLITREEMRELVEKHKKDLD